MNNDNNSKQSIDAEELEDTTLSHLDIFSKKELEVLSDYRIMTLGGLLNATKGLTNLKLLQEFDEFQTKIASLKEVVPNQILMKFRKPELDKKLGLKFSSNIQENGINDGKQ